MVVQLKRVSLLVDDVAKGLPSLWRIPLLGMIGRNDKGRLREVVPRRRIPRLGRSLIILWRPRAILRRKVRRMSNLSGLRRGEMGLRSGIVLESLVVVEIY